MVTADVGRSTSGIADAFEDRDITTILLTGGLVSFASTLVAVVGVGTLMALNVDISNLSRVHMAGMGVAMLAAGYGSVQYLPDSIAGPVAMGAALMASSAAISAVLGVRQIEDAGEQAAAKLGLSAEGVSNTMEKALPSTNTCRSCGTHAAPRGATRSVSQEPAINHGYR